MSFGVVFFGRVAACGGAEYGGGSLFAECVGECFAELLILFFQGLDSAGGGFEPAEQ
jgi:hypothetical protein